MHACECQMPERVWLCLYDCVHVYVYMCVRAYECFAFVWISESTGKQGGGGIMSIVSNAAAAVGSMLESASKKQKTDGSA